MKLTTKKFLLLFFLASTAIARENAPASCNQELAQELREISQKQNALLEDKSKKTGSLDNFNKKKDSIQAQKVALLSLQKLQSDFKASVDEIRKLDNEQYLTADAVSLMSDIEKHINNIAAHQSLRTVLDQMTGPEGKSAFMEFVKEKKAQNQPVNSPNWFVKNFYNHMKSCDKSKVHCRNFLNNLDLYIASNNSVGKKQAIIDESQIQNVVDNYGELLYYITEENGIDSPKYKEALSKHQSILNEDNLVQSKVSIFGSSSDPASIENLMRLYRASSSKENQKDIDPSLRIGSSFLKDSEIKIIQKAMSTIKGECKNSNKTCESIIASNEETKEFPELLRKLATGMSSKSKKNYNLSGNIYSQNTESAKAAYYQKLEDIIRKNIVAFDNEAIPLEVKKHCQPIQERLTERPLQEALNDSQISESFKNCVKQLKDYNVSADLSKLDAQEQQIEKSIESVIKTPEFKNLEILKAALFNQYYNQCVSKIGDDKEVPKCGLTLFDHTKTVDKLSLELQEAGENIEIRNYLKYLGFSDDKNRFSDPSYWARILNEQCNKYSEDRADEAEDSKEACGFSSCNACSAIAKYGKDAVFRRDSLQYENLPMHQYREYDKATGRMVKKRHPISSLAAHTLKYAAMNMQNIGAPLIATKRLQGNLWSMEQNALYAKQSIHWGNQYRAQMYNRLDLRNPNLFGNYLSGNSTMGFPIN